jgi:hypothetical protein
MDQEVLDNDRRVMDGVARFDVGDTTAGGSANQLILAAAGMHMHSKLLFPLLALAQASRSIPGV